jgi:AraC-like DNA-binding protein
MSWGRWYQQMRLMASIPQLLKGMAITTVALESGYESHSAYSAAFRKQFGRPPSEFAAEADRRRHVSRSCCTQSRGLRSRCLLHIFCSQRNSFQRLLIKR